MTVDTHDPRPFDCPDCGHHHEADLHAMVGHPEVHGKMPCAGCGKLLWLSLDEANEAQVELYEEHLHEEAHRDRVAAHKARVEAERAAAQATEAARATASGGAGPMLAAVIVSALVAAIVGSFMSGRADDSAADTKAADETRAALTTLRSELDAVRGAVDAAHAQARKVEADLDEHGTATATRLDALASKHDGDGEHAAATASLAESVAALKAEVARRLEALEAAQTELGNRIEGYYVAVRQLDGRLKKLEER